jgi:small-conductance mechanosensitive channel
VDLDLTALYLLAVLGTGAFAAVRVLGLLRSGTRRRIRRVMARNRLGTLDHERVGEDDVEARKLAAVERIEAQFSVGRRVLVPIILLATGLLATLPFLDLVPAAALSVLGAALTVLIGVAARPIVENAIAGLVISYSRMINIGDTVRVHGQYGTIEDISATHTTLKVWDWRRYLIPNARMLQVEFENFSLHDRFQWAYVEFMVDYDVDLDVVQRLGMEAAAESSYLADYEPPALWVSEMRPEGVVCWLPGWADTPSDAWMLRSDIRRGLMKRFREAGIAIHRHRVVLDGRGGEDRAPIRSAGGV